MLLLLLLSADDFLIAFARAFADRLSTECGYLLSSSSVLIAVEDVGGGDETRGATTTGAGFSPINCEKI